MILAAHCDLTRCLSDLLFDCTLQAEEHEKVITAALHADARPSHTDSNTASLSGQHATALPPANSVTSAQPAAVHTLATNQTSLTALGQAPAVGGVRSLRHKWTAQAVAAKAAAARACLNSVSAEELEMQCTSTVKAVYSASPAASGAVEGSSTPAAAAASTGSSSGRNGLRSAQSGFPNSKPVSLAVLSQQVRHYAQLYNVCTVPVSACPAISQTCASYMFDSIRQACHLLHLLHYLIACYRTLYMDCRF